MSKQTAVEWLTEKLNQCEPMYSGVQSNEHKEYLDILIEQAKEMERDQSQNYAEFAIKCDRKGIKILEFDSYINLYKNKNNV
jgi:rubrerythrin